MDEGKLDSAIMKKLEHFPAALRAFKAMIKDEEALSLLELANAVSIKRMGYNDHGRIHTKITVDSAIKIYNLLGMKPSLVSDDLGSEDDSLTAIVLAAFLHDIGMSLNRAHHETLSIVMVKPIMERLLAGNPNRHMIVATACEAILCHMANYKPSSVEAGIVSIADGTDMTAGRARIPHFYFERSTSGKIHSYSALSIMHVEITKAKKKPVAIEVTMSNPAGVFQVEETLMPKLRNSGLADKVEVIAIIKSGAKPDRIQLS